MNANDKILIVYHFFQKDEIYIDNFYHFFLFGYDSRFDYVVLIAGKATIELPQAENIRYIYTENINNDFGGYCALFKDFHDINHYDYYIFVNSSVRGPFLPSYVGKSWVETYIDLFSENVGGVGTVICNLDPKHGLALSYKEEFGDTHSYAHFQTTAYVLTSEVVRKLMELGFYNVKERLSKEQVIERYEIRLSQLIIKFGYQIKAILPEFNKIDYSEPFLELNPTSSYGDPSPAGSYFGRTIHPYEAIFVKTNRKTYSIEYLYRLSYSMLQSNHQAQYLFSNALLPYAQKLIQSAELTKKKHVEFKHGSWTVYIELEKLKGMNDEIDYLKYELEQLGKYHEDVIHSYETSTSWKITKIIRTLKDFVKNF